MSEETRTLWCGNLSDKVTEEILYELFLQAAPLEAVRIPPDKNGRKSNYGFVVVKHEVSVDYAVQLLDGTLLFDRNITVKPRTANRTPQPPPHADADVILLNKPAFNRQRHNPHRNRPYNRPYHRNEHHNSGWRNRRTYY